MAITSSKQIRERPGHIGHGVVVPIEEAFHEDDRLRKKGAARKLAAFGLRTGAFRSTNSKGVTTYKRITSLGHDFLDSRA
ncbi:hypothetical protein SAMN05421868_14435 [Paenibacillus naphthalenovorans]|nr:hypothetical protein SAMN05421868_14435 [Paenibacillus naphthalenovorans]